MLETFLPGSFRCWKPRTSRHLILNLVYLTLCCYLILYSIFTTLYLDRPRLPTRSAPYDIPGVEVRPIWCTFPVSSQYQKLVRLTCYLLLAFTVLIRNYTWLAAGAAASVMTYSGVTAIHAIVFFATQNRFNPPEARFHCDEIPIRDTTSTFTACVGVEDPDFNITMWIVGTVMLGALPMAAWSTTFKSSTSKVILVSWLLLLAAGHTFDNVILTDLGEHWQICQKNRVEPLPGFDFQAPPLDKAWVESFNELVATGNRSSDGKNGSYPTCIYSCFATSASVGRRRQDIIVDYPRLSPNPFIKSSAADRSGGIIFWWTYTLLAVLTLFTTEKKDRLPRWMHKRVFSVSNWQETVKSKWKRRGVRRHTDTVLTLANIGSLEVSKHDITITTIMRMFTQLVSVSAFGGAIILQETGSARAWKYLEREPFAAVGQWGNLGVILLVLLAALIRRLWVGSGSHSLTEVEKAKEDREYLQDAKGEVDWDWRVGYAS